MPEIEIGVVTHYFGHINVAAICSRTASCRVGDTIRIKGHTADFTCTVDSMQVDHKSVAKAKKGDGVGHEGSRQGPRARQGVQSNSVTRSRGDW